MPTPEFLGVLMEESSPGASISALLLARRYAEAIALARSLGPDEPERDALLRMCLARDSQFDAAVEAGRRHLRRPHATPEDHYRQAQILLRCGCFGEALDCAMVALRSAPEEWRYQVPVIEAVLADPALEAKFRRTAEAIALAQPYCPPDQPEGAVDLRVPTLLPHYASIEGAHPVFASVIGMLDGIRTYWPRSYGSGLVAAMLLRLERAKGLRDQLLAIGDPAVDRGIVARYVAARFPSMLAPEMGAMDFLQHGPICTGEKPYVFLFDNLATLCQPFLPMEDMNLPEDEPGLHALLRRELSGPACCGIVSIFRDGARYLGHAFGDDAIRRKTINISPPWSIEDVDQARPVASVRGTAETITWFFPASASSVVENFYLRGGVDVLNAFATLANEDSRIRLILRGPLPSNLSPRLKALVADHPGITWLPNRLSHNDYAALLRRADLLVLPSTLSYRNGLVEAIRWGLVPVLSDCCNSNEMVEDGVEGIIVPGRRYGISLNGDRPGFRADWVELLQATDEPPDPEFHQRLLNVLRGLGQDRAAVRRLSRHNLENPCRGETTQDDVARLNDLVRAQIGSLRLT